MNLFIIFFTVVAWTSAAPTLELLHPSPVNPNVLVAIKPEEKIVLITDPQEIAKFKRETEQPFYPTVLPETQEHYITKRENKEIEIKVNKAHDEKTVEHQNLKVSDLQKPQTLPLFLKESSPAIEQHKRDIPVPLVPKYHHPEESSTEISKVESNTDKEIADPTTKDKEQKVQDTKLKIEQKPQILQHEQEQQHVNLQTNTNQKRNLSKAENDKHNDDAHNIQVEDDHKPTTTQDDNLSASSLVKSSTVHPFARPNPVPVAELFARGY